MNSQRTIHKPMPAPSFVDVLANGHLLAAGNERRLMR